ncbi:hypothetical protein GPK29_22635 [Aeromonas hydrophila]|uniref:hypothetical protein n=1 Tax=Aeromonas hydrophila TaxID=644 RepID=UPI001C5B9123|nr:hypothetical protein [Aeromonas hydrophila]MBW3798994.1 hypothetical protein [Aeromonas hydrophila]MBW3803786.1 hypothetical protein [Aeromonas hydrophila]MBW3821750.1 hypothetical protein [Aeromonas hydrophila]
MKYTVQVTGYHATIMEDVEGRYPSILLAVKAVIRAAKDTDITGINLNGVHHKIMDDFTGGLLRDSQIILMTTGIFEQDQGLFTRIKLVLTQLISTWLSDQAYKAKTKKTGYLRNEILDSTLKGPFDARLEPLSYRSIKRRMHKH